MFFDVFGMADLSTYLAYKKCIAIYTKNYTV